MPPAPCGRHGPSSGGPPVLADPPLAHSCSFGCLSARITPRLLSAFPAQAVRRVRTAGSPASILARAGYHVGHQPLAPHAPGSHDAVEAIPRLLLAGLPVASDSDRRRGRASLHLCGVLLDHLHVDAGPGRYGRGELDLGQVRRGRHHAFPAPEP
jgi:hypothetical protein